MDIILTNAGGQPIYDQIVSQIKAQILSGTLKDGGALPAGMAHQPATLEDIMLYHIKEEH